MFSSLVSVQAISSVKFSFQILLTKIALRRASSLLTMESVGTIDVCEAHQGRLACPPRLSAVQSRPVCSLALAFLRVSSLPC